MPIREDIEKSVKIKTDTIEEKMNNIIDTLDNTTYYVATINNLDIPLELFGKIVPQKHPSEQIKITREKFNELKNQKYFYTEIVKDEPDGKKIIGIETIIKPADVTHHHELERILKEPTSIKIIEQPEHEPESISPTPRLSTPLIKKEREPSKYQKDIFNYITWLATNDRRVTHKHIVIEAVAGSGKTWTIEHATKLIPPSKTVVFLAFNVTIKDELAKRAPKHVTAMTLNGAGYQALRYALKMNGKHNLKPDNNNVKNILNSLFKDKYKHLSIEEIDVIKPVVNRLVSLYKATGLPVNLNTFEELQNKHALLSLFEGDYDANNIISLVKDVMEINFNVLTNSWYGIDFDDQIWLPVIKNLPIEKYDFVFVDETQDLNATQLELVIKMCKKTGSIIAVGDRNQSIYQFRGADAEAIPHIIKRLNAKIFPLSISYRCPVSVTKLAQTLVPEIEYATIENAGYDAIEGEIINTTSQSLIELAKPKDRVICRNAAPLVHPCFELIKAGKKATILGREIGENLIKLMEEIKGHDIDDFMFRLNRWYENKSEKLTEKMQFEALDRLTDQYETLLVLSEDCESIECILHKIKTIFSEDKDSITFSTIHKAKGLEAETPENSIFIIMSHKGRQLIPSPYAKREEQLKQEMNLLYVAYTRAKNKLYLVD